MNIGKEETAKAVVRTAERFNAKKRNMEHVTSKVKYIAHLIQVWVCVRA